MVASGRFASWVNEGRAERCLRDLMNGQRPARGPKDCDRCLKVSQLTAYPGDVSAIN